VNPLQGLLDCQFGRLHGFRPEMRVSLLPITGVVQFISVRRPERLTVKQLERCVLDRPINESGTRIRGSAKDGIMVMTQPKIQSYFFTELYFILGVNSPKVRFAFAAQVLKIGLLVVIT